MSLVVIGRARENGHVGRDAEPARAHRRRRVRVRRARREDRTSSTPRPSWRSCRRCTRASRFPAIEAMACAVPVVATTGGALPEVVGADGETAYLVAPGDAEALAARLRDALDDPEGRARVGDRRTPPGGRAVELANTAEPTVEHYRTLLTRAGRAVGAGRGRGADRSLRLARAAAPATACSTWAAAPAVTPSKRPGAGPTWSPSTSTGPSSRTSPACSRRCPTPGELDSGGTGGVGERRRPAAAVPRRRASTGSSPPRSSSTSSRTRPPSPSWPGCSGRAGRWPSPCPAWLPERVCWALSEQYHAPVRRRRPRPHLHRAEAAGEAAGRRSPPRRRPSRPRPALALLVAQVRGRRRPTTTTLRSRPTTGCWCGTSCERRL